MLRLLSVPDAIAAAPALPPLLDLAGRWTIRRTIPGHGRFDGEAVATRRSDDRFGWRETGVMRLVNGTRSEAHRGLVFAQGPGWLEIWYADGPNAGTRMHRFDLAVGPRAWHVHSCAPDTYAASLRISGPGIFQLGYTVTGPRKAYRMSTLYRRAPTGPSGTAPLRHACLGG